MEIDGERKGEKIKFIGGKYKGLIGYIDKEKTDTPQCKYVIVKLKDGNEKATYVKKKNVKLAKSRDAPKPTNYIDAMLESCPDIEADLNRLAMKVASCGHKEEKLVDLKPLYSALGARIKAARKQQKDLGAMAKWRLVEY